MTSSGMEYPPVSLGRVFRLCSLQTPRPPPAYSLNVPKERRAEWETEPWCCASTVWQHPKPWCGIIPALAPQPKHSTLWAAMKKVHSIPARPNTLPKGLINPLLTRQDIIYIEAWIILKELFAIPFWFQDIYKCQILFVGTNPVVHWEVSVR